MVDNYGGLLEAGEAPERAFIEVEHPTRDRKYQCDGCKKFVWPYQMADFRKVPAALKGGDPDIDFACDGCATTFERLHGATLPAQPDIPGPKIWRGGGPTQGPDWRTKQRDWRDQVKAAQERPD